MSERKDTTGTRSIRLNSRGDGGGCAGAAAASDSAGVGGRMNRVVTEGERYIRGGGNGLGWLSSQHFLMGSKNG